MDWRITRSVDQWLKPRHICFKNRCPKKRKGSLSCGKGLRRTFRPRQTSQRPLDTVHQVRSGAEHGRLRPRIYVPQPGWKAGRMGQGTLGTQPLDAARRQATGDQVRNHVSLPAVRQRLQEHCVPVGKIDHDLLQVHVTRRGPAVPGFRTSALRCCCNRSVPRRGCACSRKNAATRSKSCQLGTENPFSRSRTCAVLPTVTHVPQQASRWGCTTGVVRITRMANAARAKPHANWPMRRRTAGKSSRHSEAVRKWDWLRASTTENPGNTWPARCLSQFFHSLSVPGVFRVTEWRVYVGGTWFCRAAVRRRPPPPRWPTAQPARERSRTDAAASTPESAKPDKKGRVKVEKVGRSRKVEKSKSREVQGTTRPAFGRSGFLTLRLFTLRLAFRRLFDFLTFRLVFRRLFDFSTFPPFFDFSSDRDEGDRDGGQVKQLPGEETDLHGRKSGERPLLARGSHVARVPVDERCDEVGPRT